MKFALSKRRTNIKLFSVGIVEDDYDTIDEKPKSVCTDHKINAPVNNIKI